MGHSDSTFQRQLKPTWINSAPPAATFLCVKTLPSRNNRKEAQWFRQRDPALWQLRSEMVWADRFRRSVLTVVARKPCSTHHRSQFKMIQSEAVTFCVMLRNKNVNRKRSIHQQEGDCKVVNNLSNASSGLTFGQMMRCSAIKASIAHHRFLTPLECRTVANASPSRTTQVDPVLMVK